MKKAIFWDSDGTLLYGNESFKCSLMRAFEEWGYFLSASVGYEKPRREIFGYSILKAGNPEIKYMIGDNPVADYQGGLMEKTQRMKMLK